MTFLLLLGLTFFPYGIAHAEKLTGKVVGVADGDTLTILSAGNQQTRIRLAQIDAPEKRQPFGQKSKESLSDQVYGQMVDVDIRTIDRYGRSVGTVYRDGEDINLIQIQRGMAWVYRQYANDPNYFRMEKTARQERIGLWSDPSPVPPWEFRHTERSNSRRTPKD